MYRYFTKSFTDPAKIDKWLKDFNIYPDNQYQIIGYTGIGNAVIITVRVFEFQKVDLTKLPKRGEK